jgi:hypothetical protein
MRRSIQTGSDVARGPSAPNRKSRASTMRMMAETLEPALSHFRGQAVRIRKVQRDVCDYTSSFQAEHLRIALDDGDCIPVFFKDLNPEHQIEPAKKVRTIDLGPSYHELRVYRKILSQIDLGTPQLYAVRWEPHRGIYWLFLEDVGDSRLRDSRNYERWVPAARWAARFHAATLRLPKSQLSFLREYDGPHYRACAEKVRAILPELEARDQSLVRRALQRYTDHIDWYESLPRTVIHGQFFGKNIMLRCNSGDNTLAVIDWETAALGPGGYDLVSVSSGRWTREQRQAMWRVYFDQYEAETRVSRSWEDFCQEIRELELYQALEWLAWWRNRSVSHNFGKWIKELGRIMNDNPIARPEVLPRRAIR